MHPQRARLWLQWEEKFDVSTTGVVLTEDALTVGVSVLRVVTEDTASSVVVVTGAVDSRSGVVLVPDTGVVVSLEPGSSSECDRGVGVGGGDTSDVSMLTIVSTNIDH